MSGPLGRTLHGSGHFRWQRLTAMVNIALTAIVVGLLVSIAGVDHASVLAMVGHPLVGVIFLLFIVVSAFHMSLGMQVIIDDYIHETGARRVAHFFSGAFALGVAALGALALARISFGAF